MDATDASGALAEFPPASQLTGLLANALGYDQGAFGAHQRLQDRLGFASRLDRVGRRRVDYQTVDLGQPHLKNGGWTTHGRMEGRATSTLAHERWRAYWEERRCIVALTLKPDEETPTLDELALALRKPARPLFLGRKTCLPSCPLLAAELTANSLVEALLSYPDTETQATGKQEPGEEHRRVPAQWPTHEDIPSRASDYHLVKLADERDWANQFHAGQRTVRQGTLLLHGDSP